ncbi:DUF5686 family protein [candidate division KSB1 bacterium]
MSKLLKVLLVMGIVLNFLPLFSGESYSQEKNLTEIRFGAEELYLKNKRYDKKRITGDYYINEGEKEYQNYIITQGKIEISGTVYGSVVVIEGSIHVTSTGTLRGDAIAISGEITKERGGIIAGDEINNDWRSMIRRRPKTIRRWNDDISGNGVFGWDSQIYDDTIVPVRYNRVEGLYLGFKWADALRDYNRFLNLSGHVGYAFGQEQWRYTVGLEKKMFAFNTTKIGVKGYMLTDSDDFWRIAFDENSAAAFFLKEDFLDLYYRSGVTTYISQEIGYNTSFKLEYRDDKIKSMENSVDWALFGKNKVFRPNMPVNTGEMKSVNFLGIYNSGYTSGRGMWVRLETEITNPDLGGIFDYSRYILDIRKYQPITRYENINARVIFGSSKGVLPVQRRFYLGGISSLRGMRYKEFSGSSMFLANLDYIFDTGRILQGPTEWILDNFKIGIFFDAGVVSEATTSNYFKELKSGSFMHDLGFGIMTRKEDKRLDFAWRTDLDNEPVRITFRVNRTF